MMAAQTRTKNRKKITKQQRKPILKSKRKTDLAKQINKNLSQLPANNEVL